MSFTKTKFAIKMPIIALLGMASLFILYIPQVQGQRSCATNEGFKDGAEAFVTVRRSTRRGAKNKAEILWQPQDMLKDPTCYSVQAAELEMKQEGVDQWTIAEVDTKPHGKAIKWTVKIKPCLKYHFRIKVTGNDVNSKEASLEIPESLEADSEENILKSGYTPDAPTGFEAEVSSGSAELSWKPSDCATNYEMYYVEAGGEEIATTKNTGGVTSGSVKDLKPCTRYDTIISAILGDKYGDFSTEFATQPRLDAARGLNVKTTAGLDSVQLSWPAWQEVSCIDEYKVKACISNTAECTEEEIIEKFVGSPFVNHKVTGLKPCTDYTLHIQPVFQELNIEVKEVEFRTNSMDATQLNIDRVGSEVLPNGLIYVNWSPISCAAKYKVYQKEVGVQGWLEVAEIEDTEKTETTVNDITPCTKYQFAISAVLVDADGKETETEKTPGPEKMSDLDKNNPFKVPRHHIVNADDKINIEWGHADCIDSYKIKSCPKEGPYLDCTEEVKIPENSGDKMITHTIENLTPCTKYDLEIIPVINGKGPFTAQTIPVQTTNGTPEAPQFEVELIPGTSDANVKWYSANCATGYKVYYKAGEEAEKEEVEDASESDLIKTFKGNKPCQEYLYSVTTMVNEQESPRINNNWKNVVIPPNRMALPNLRMVDDNADNVTLKIDPALENNQCNIDLYEVVYSSGQKCCEGGCETKTKKFTPEELENGDIVLYLEGGAPDATLFKARVRYEQGNEWSNEVSLGETSQSLCNPESKIAQLPLIPIVVGVAVLALVVLVVTVLLIKRSRNRNFDPEKAENGNAKKSSNHHQNLVNSDEEETQKLNDAHV